MTTVLTSAALKKGLASYGRSSFMCNTMHKLLDFKDAHQVERAIGAELGEYYTLDGMLIVTDYNYKSLRELAGCWRTEELFAIRVKWWQAFIQRLESQGL